VSQKIDYGPQSNFSLVTMLDSAKTAAFTGDWQMFQNCNIIAALSGTATSCIAVVERSATDPNGPFAANAVLADSTGFNGNLATGVPANVYQEASVGWWRIRATTVSGGTCTASLSGLGG
jgi:hypothetical protein